MINKFREEIAFEAYNILDFWDTMIDQENGGFYGYFSDNLELDKEAERGGIACARLLWSYSSAYRVLGSDKYLKVASHMFGYIKDFVMDPEQKGVYWMIDHKGSVIDDRKHIYAQAFMIYSLSEYYRISGDKLAKEMAIELFHIIETTGFNNEKNIYKEEFTRSWEPTSNEMLSENGIIAEATTNTHLHILEAYTNLYRVWEDEQLASALKGLIDIFKYKLVRKDHFIKVFYDTDYKEKLDIKSYGHDIEATWLLTEALNVLNDQDKSFIKPIINNIYELGRRNDGSIKTECENGVDTLDRVWWVQSEAIVGFYNGYQMFGEEKYLKQCFETWNYTKMNIIDHSSGSEWFWAVDENGKSTGRAIVEPWKTPYHNLRFCLEIIERITL